MHEGDSIQDSHQRTHARTLGVDPGAAGLAVTTEGKPKLIDTIDCSGSGDVDTATVVAALAGDDRDGAPDNVVVIQGLTGRKLRLNPAWDNPSGRWHVGVKRATELYPRGLAPRVKAERKKEWMVKVRGRD